MREKQRTRAYACAAGAALMLLGGCKHADAPKSPPPPEVAVMTVQPRSVPETYEFTGEVEPFRRVEVRARIDGVIEGRAFTEGASVKPGQVLYRIERVRPEAGYRSALARYENAKRTLERLEPLVAQNAVAQQDVDNARADVEAAEAALTEAKKNVDEAVVRATIEGRIGRSLMEPGARVTGPADLLTTIDVLDPVYVSFRPSAQQLLAWHRNPESASLVRPGGALSVHVTLPDGSPLPRAGRLDFIAPSLDATTGTQEFRARFQNPDKLLLPGQFVRTRLVGFVRKDAFAVPQRAVQQALGRQFVYLVGKGDTVLTRDVQPGPWSGSLWIIDKGLNPGDRVVVDGVQKVAAGRPVRPVPLADSVTTGPEETAKLGAAQ